MRIAVAVAAVLAGALWLGAPRVAAAAGTADPRAEAIALIRQAAAGGDAHSAEAAFDRVERFLVGRRDTAIANRQRQANRKTYDLLRLAERELETFRQEHRTFSFAKAEGLPYSPADAARLASILLPTGETPNVHRPALHLDPAWIVQATDRYVVWTVDGTTRVSQSGFELDQQAWHGDEFRNRLECEAIDGATATCGRPRGITIAAAGHEYEPFQIVITPKERASLQIGRARVAPFRQKGGPGRIGVRNVSVHLVGYVAAEDPRTKLVTHGPHADVLFPEGYRVDAKPGFNYTLWFTVYVPAGTPPGDYEGSVTLNVDAMDLPPIPVRIHVWAFDLPVETHVDTQLFTLQLNSLQHYYGVAYWQDRGQALIRDWADRMARHRFSLFATPPAPRPPFETFPARGDGPRGKHLAFDGNLLPMPGIDDHPFRDGFTFCCWLRTLGGTDAQILSHHWAGRPCGSDLALERGQLKASIGLGFPTRRKQDIERTASVSAPWPKGDEWRHVAVRYAPGSLELYIGATLVGRQTIAYRYAPAYDGFQLGSGAAGERFNIDELRWAKHALSPAEIREEMRSASPLHATFASFSFEGAEYDFARRSLAGTTEELDANWFWQWVEWSQSRGLWLNDLRPLRKIAAGDDESMRRFADTYYAQLSRRRLLSKTYVRLPSDEGVYGPRRERNIAFARAVHKHMPELRRHQTLGAMHWGQTSKQTKREAIEALIGHVDIWSMVPLVMTTFWDDVFRARVEAGDAMCLYINRTEAIERPYALPAARAFLWYLWKYDLDKLNYWGTTLWSQADKGSKPEKRTWEVDWGFRFWRRDPSPGMTAAVLFWPGKHGLLDSIRAENWREGIEDYEYLVLLGEALAHAHQTGAAGPAVTSAQALLERLRSMKTHGRNFEGPPITDTRWFFEHRREIAEAIESLREPTPPGD